MGKSQETSLERRGCKSTPYYFIFLVAVLGFIIVYDVLAQGEFVGSINSDKYHYPSCTWAGKINPENKIWFVDAADAVTQGYVPCKVCNPPLPSSSTPTPTFTPTPTIIPTATPTISPTPSPAPTLTPVPTPTYRPAPMEDQITVFVDDVIDDDTFDTTEGYRIRLADINAPESYETGYQESKGYLRALIESETTLLIIDSITRTDPYGRLVCLVFFELNATHYLNVNLALVMAGHAVEDDYLNNEFNPDTWQLYSPMSTLLPTQNPTPPPSQTPTPTSTPTSSPTPTHTPTFSPTPSPAPTPTPTPVPTSTPMSSPTLSPSPTPTNSPSPIPTLNPTSTPNPTPTLTPTPLPEDGEWSIEYTLGIGASIAIVLIIVAIYYRHQKLKTPQRN